MNRNLKYLLILLGVTFLFLGYQYFKQAGLQAYRYVGQSRVELDSLADGTYQGSFQPFDMLTLARVQFKVKNGKVQQIAIPRLTVSPWNSIKSTITDSIRTRQSVKFDAITGATRSSFFVKAALHDACSEKDQPDNPPGSG